MDFKLSNLTNSHSKGDGIKFLFMIINDLCNLVHGACGIIRCLYSPFFGIEDKSIY